ncbi:MAG: dockerin type I domain-containing protein, partial [Planctomycetota bacterium]|nr:dockerin type I domain-containing protein [Planctomycetota bacterium]
SISYPDSTKQTFAFDPLGNLAAAVMQNGDAIGQLIGIGLPGGQSISYAYNSTGDRTQVNVNGTATTYTSNAVNEITQVGPAAYSYDANGNLHTITDNSGTTIYNYNDLNQLLAITAPDGAATSFQYSPLGFMVGITSGNGADQTNYLVDPAGLANVVSSYTGDGALIAHYNFGLGVLANQTGPSGIGYYDFDQMGNTVGISGSGGVYVNHYSYLPFGETTIASATLPNPFTFSGETGVIQSGTNLFNMRARQYSVTTGQFLSNDPISLGGGDSNLRRYANNAPTNFVDPSGNDSAKVYFWNANGGTGHTAIEVNGNYLEIRPQGDTNSIAGALSSLFMNTVGAVVGLTVRGDYSKSAANNGATSSYTFGVSSQQAEQMSAAINHRKEVIDTANQVGFPTYNLYTKSCASDTADVLNAGGINIPLGIQLSPHIFEWYIKNLTSHDPNALIGPAGYGTQNFIQDSGVWPYTVEFENTGSIAAQEVIVTEQLDSNLDWSTFEFGSFGFGPVKVAVPAGLTQYQTTVSYQNSDGSTLNVQASLDFNVQTGLLTATCVSLDPSSGQAPTGVFDGFLPPDNSSGIGEGYVQYTLQPKAGLTTGTTINPQASVVFDTNAPLATPQFPNTIDASPPTSSVAALPATETSPSFLVTWSGADDSGGSGIATYTICVSDNGGEFQPWLTGTANTSATFPGQNGHNYAFSSLATDNVGHRQSSPSASATTQVVANPWHNFANPCDVDGQNGVTPLDVLIVINYINSHPVSTSLPAAPTSPPPYYDVADGTGDQQVTPLDVLTVIIYINSHPSGSAEGEAAESVGRPALATGWPAPRADEGVVPAGYGTRLTARTSAVSTPSPYSPEEASTVPRPKLALATIPGISGRLDAIRVRPSNRLASDQDIGAIDAWSASPDDIGSDLAADVAAAWRA